MESKTKEPIMIALGAANIILTLVNFALEYATEKWEEATKGIRENELKEFEKVILIWRKMQESQCIFFKFLRFFTRANTVVVYIHSKLMIAKVEQACQNNQCQNEDLKTFILDKIKKIEELQKNLEDMIDKRVSDICSLNGEQAIDQQIRWAEKQRGELLKKLGINVAENLETSGNALDEVNGAIMGDAKVPDEEGPLGKLGKLTKDLVLTSKDTYDRNIERKEEIEDALKEKKLLNQKDKTDLANGLKGQKNAQFDVSARKGAFKTKMKGSGKPKTGTFLTRALKMGDSLNTFTSSLKSSLKPKDDENKIFSMLKGIFKTVNAGINFFLYIVGLFSKSKTGELMDAIADLNDAVLELLLGLVEVFEKQSKLTSSQFLNFIVDHVWTKLIPAAAKVGYKLALIFAQLLKAKISAMVQSVVDLVFNVCSVIENLSKLWNAINEYEEEELKSFTNQKLRNYFTLNIRNNLNYQKCETLSQISSTQRMIDKNRLILKQFYVSEKQKFSDTRENSFSKSIISTFIDEVCNQDVNLCLAIFNDSIFSYYKNQDFLKDLYYRSTRSAITSVAIAKSEQDELTLLSMGYKEYISFRSSQSRDCGYHNIKPDVCRSNKLCTWKPEHNEGPHCFFKPYLEYKDCGHSNISEDECKKKNCEYKRNHGASPFACFHKPYMSIMVCRGCSSTHAVTDIIVKEDKDSDLQKLLKDLSANQNDKILRAYSLFFKKNVQYYLIVTESTLKLSTENYVHDFELWADNDLSSGFRTRIKSSNLLGSTSITFGNKPAVFYANTLIYTKVIVQKMKEESLCETREGNMVFLSRKDNTVLYLAAANATCSSRSGQVSSHNILGSISNLKQINDFILPGLIDKQILVNYSYVEEGEFFKKSLYRLASGSTNQNDFKITEASFNPIFRPNNSLYDLVDSNLCRANDKDTCFFQENKIRETIHSDFAKSYSRHDLRNMMAFSHLKYFENLQKKLFEGNPITLAEFNQIGLSHNQMGHQKYRTVYNFFRELRDGRTTVNKDHFILDRFKFLVPIKFEKICPPGEQALYFDEVEGPVETCTNENPENKNHIGWLRMETNYYIYFHHAHHGRNAGDLTTYTKGWIPHPDMSRGFNYKNNQNGFEFTFEVYLRPFFGSGFVPIGKHSLGKAKCVKLDLSKQGYTGAFLISFIPGGHFLNDIEICNNDSKEKCINSIFPLPPENQRARSEELVNNNYIDSESSPLNREYVDMNQNHKVYFGARHDQKFLYYFIYLFFNNPTPLRKKNGVGEIEFAPNTMAQWKGIFGKSCPSFFSTEECNPDSAIKRIYEGCKPVLESFFFPVTLSNDKKYLEFRNINGKVHLVEDSHSQTSNKIDSVFYYEMKPCLKTNCDEYKVNYEDDDTKLLVDFGYRLFSPPVNIINNSTVKDDHFLKTWKDVGTFFFRFWVRDDYRVPFEKQDVCGLNEIRVIAKGVDIPRGWRLITLEEGKKMKDRLKDHLNSWSIIGFETGQMETQASRAVYEIKDVQTEHCGEFFIAHW